MDFERIDRAVAAYVEMRDRKKALDDAHKESLKPLCESMEKLESLMLTWLNQTGQENAKTKAGTVYIRTDASATIADKEMFRRHVIGSQDWDLIDWRANKTAVRTAVQEVGHPPPGINFSTIRTVGVRRPSGEQNNG